MPASVGLAHSYSTVKEEAGLGLRWTLLDALQPRGQTDALPITNAVKYSGLTAPPRPNQNVS